jgi:hypothetical protein
MAALIKLRQWLRSKIRPPEPGPDGRDLQLPAKSHPRTDFNQGLLHFDVERQLQTNDRETRRQQNWRSRAGPWQQK